MFVLFAGGMVRVTIARSRIRSTRAAISAGVSNITPAGATPKVESAGCAEWQTAHRRSITCRASSNETRAGSDSDAAVLGDVAGTSRTYRIATPASIVPASAGFQDGYVNRMLS